MLSTRSVTPGKGRSGWMVVSRVNGAAPAGATSGRTGSIDAHGWERSAVLPAAHPPRIQEHAREVTGVVDMEVTEEDSLQACEVESCLDECRWRPPPAVDDEDASVDDES